MRERYVNILAALRERYVSVLAALRGRFYIATREKAHRCLSAIAEVQSIADYKYSSIPLF